MSEQRIFERGFAATATNAEQPLNTVDVLTTDLKPQSNLLANGNQKEESLAEMAGRVLLSAGAGYLTRSGAFLTGMHRIPKIGPACVIAAPFAVAGLTSSYMKSGELTDLRAMAEGMASYGFVAQGFRRAEQDLGMYFNRLSVPAASKTLGRGLNNSGWDEAGLANVDTRKMVGKLTAVDALGIRVGQAPASVLVSPHAGASRMR